MFFWWLFTRQEPWGQTQLRFASFRSPSLTSRGFVFCLPITPATSYHDFMIVMKYLHSFPSSLRNGKHNEGTDCGLIHTEPFPDT